MLVFQGSVGPVWMQCHVHHMQACPLWVSSILPVPASPHQAAQTEGARRFWHQPYLEALLDGYHAARSRASHACGAAADACADALVPLLARRFDDPCINSPDLRDQLLQTVSLLLQAPPLLARFEASADARSHLVGPRCFRCPGSVLTHPCQEPLWHTASCMRLPQL